MAVDHNTDHLEAEHDLEGVEPNSEGVGPNSEEVELEFVAAEALPVVVLADDTEERWWVGQPAH